MTVRVVFLALGAMVLGGCNVGGYQFTEVEGRGGWRAEREAACMAAREPSPTITEVAAVVEGDCGMDQPLKVTALANGSVRITPEPTLGCPLTDALETWVANYVQPAARAGFNADVVEIQQISAYACRNRNNFGKELSEHAFGNALDISAFKLSNGRTIEIQNGWKGDDRDQAFLRKAFAGACQQFVTVLGPGSNIMHYNHFHMDLAKLAPDGSPKMCKPNLSGSAYAAPSAVPELPVVPGGTAEPGAD